MTNPAQQLRDSWAKDPRWAGIRRTYTAEDVVRLRGSVQVEHTLARLGAEKLWKLCNEKPFVNSLGALTGNQAMQQVKAGIKAIYLSGWQVAADANIAGEMYPDQSLYPSSSVPEVVRRINKALQRADQVQHADASPMSLLYWTGIGMYIIPGDNYDVLTVVETPSSTSRAGGCSCARPGVRT